MKYAGCNQPVAHAEYNFFFFFLKTGCYGLKIDSLIIKYKRIRRLCHQMAPWHSIEPLLNLIFFAINLQEFRVSIYLSLFDYECAK